MSAVWVAIAASVGSAVVLGAAGLAWRLAKRKRWQLVEQRRQKDAQHIRDEAFPVAIAVTGIALLLERLFRSGAK